MIILGECQNVVKSNTVSEHYMFWKADCQWGSLLWTKHNNTRDLRLIHSALHQCDLVLLLYTPRPQSINLNKAMVISFVMIGCCSWSCEPVWFIATLHPNSSVGEFDAHIPNKHVWREEVLQSVDTITRHAVEWVTHGALIWVQFVPDSTENCSVSTRTFCILVYLWINEQNDGNSSCKFQW